MPFFVEAGATISNSGKPVRKHSNCASAFSTEMPRACNCSRSCAVKLFMDVYGYLCLFAFAVQSYNKKMTYARTHVIFLSFY